MLLLGLSELSAPSVVSAEATWYGSLRAGVESHKSDTKFADGGSRWGIKGSSEISDGLTAVYRFEHKINTAKASLTDGRLAYAGLKGGFGTITAGQIWSASFNSVGAITDNSFAYGNSETTYRHGSVVSYANSFGPASVQLDLVMDGARDSGNKDIDQVEFGLSVALGDIGKIAIAHVKKEDSMPGTHMVDVVVQTLSTSITTVTMTAATTTTTTTTTIATAVQYVPKAWEGSKAITGTSMTLNVKPAEIMVPATLKSFTRLTTGSNPNGNADVSTKDTCDFLNTNVKNTCETRKVYTTKASTTTAAPTDIYFLADDVTPTKNPGSKSNHIAAEFSFGGVIPHLGYSEKKMNGKMKKDKTTFVGVRGSVGDTGFGYVFQYRDKEEMKEGMMIEYEPWILGLSKTMGGGASLHFEHSGGMKDEKGKKVKSKTGVWLKVDF